MSIKEDTSKRILSLRWLCIASVVLVHSAQWFYFQPHSMERLAGVSFCYEPVFRWVLDIVGYGISVGIVPTFFIISGYLHFSKDRSYGKVVVSKTKTLLLPLLIWTAIACLAYLALKPLVGTDSAFAFLSSRNPLDWLKAIFGDYSDFLHGGASTPLLYQFWFIRDLFILMLLSPVIGWCLRKLPIIYMVLCAVCLVLAIVPVVGPNALFYFSLGGLCAIREWDFFDFADKWCPWWLIIPCAAAAVVYTHSCNDNIHMSVNFLTQLPSFLAYLKISKKIISSEKAFRLTSALAPQAMFMYCAHSLMLISVLGLTGSAIFPVDTSWGIVCSMLFVFILDVTICTCAGMLLRRYTPRTFALLSGNR